MAATVFRVRPSLWAAARRGFADATKKSPEFEHLYGISAVVAALAAGRRQPGELFVSDPEALDRADVKHM